MEELYRLPVISGMALAPLALRRRAARVAARERLAVRTTRHVQHDARPWDPQAWSAVEGRTGAIRGLATSAGSLLLHGLLVALGVSGAGAAKERHLPVSVQVREHPPAPAVTGPTQEEPGAPALAPPRSSDKQQPRRQASAQPEVAAKAQPAGADPTKPSLPRVVGLSLDSTTVTGNGPIFASGSTLAGPTATGAAAPSSVAPRSGGSADAGPPPTGNRVARHIPTAASSFVLPKRKHQAVLPYPEALKAQGLEADVTVFVNLDAAGRVTNVKVVKSSGYPDFDDAAVRAARAEEFAPATRDGEAVSYSLGFTYRFRLAER